MTRLFFLHALGASARSWDRVIEALPGHDNVALDLPGFGDNAAMGHWSVVDTLHWFAGEVARYDSARWIVVGHSMGGKIATLTAARRPAGLAGVVLVAASPPAPEPMDEARRAEMLDWFANGPATQAQAEKFVAANTAGPLPHNLAEKAIADVRGSSPAAWRGWLKEGAREDWDAKAGVINLPALIVAGAEDGDLGEDAQRRLNAPHYTHPRVEVIAEAAHLIPYEKPEALAALIAAHVRHIKQEGER
ncbi:Pimeloyl-ACP methyl ester carboxylesterase [Sphingomonas palmae]|uniref:Pimeloyl-ACP methyl ester carboxylesterase n=1 Tax=Sphingomonas palmae TaxID=1855283 RepID=A0A1H7UX78_9SPHN|nr:alpha/beta hydrolase [Sphingomonas palmae]SEM01238.1 Pimeloyl-ACP methyl ester carboxylesterase [Sphingomonas palmae]